MTGAVIVAAGASRRMGFDKLTALLNGKPVWEHSVEVFQKTACVDAIYLVVSPGSEEAFEIIGERYPKLKQLVPGGRERQDSVRNGLEALSDSCEYVAVHDAARPLVTSAMIEGCFALAEKEGAAVCAEPCSDTLQRADQTGHLIETIDRTNVWRMQTPQIFTHELLLEAMWVATMAGRVVTDEVSAILAFGKTVRVFEVSDWNFKVTYPRDLQLAEQILQARVACE